MSIKHYFLLSTLSLFIACNGDGCGSSGASTVSSVATSAGGGAHIGKGVDVGAIAAKRGSLLVPACLIVPLDRVAKLVGVSSEAIDIRDSSPKDANASHSSCFFKWDDDRVVSAGILLQILKNPLGDEEYPDYVQMFIDSKRNSGEANIDGDKDIFKYFPGFGDDAVYSYVAGKYFWQMDNKVIMSIAFNTAHTEQEQFSIATALATDMINNYVKGF